jgi:hypothetical protein
VAPTASSKTVPPSVRYRLTAAEPNASTAAAYAGTRVERKGIQGGWFNTRLPERKPRRAGRVAAGRRTARCYAHPMLRPIADLPEGVLGFEATGEIQASDYRDVLMPAVREVWERWDEVRIVLVFERWEGMSSGAAWEDLKVGMKNLTKWKRIALVTDLDWMITVASLFGWMTPGDLKRFPVAEREQAIAWAAGDG